MAASRPGIWAGAAEPPEISVVVPAFNEDGNVRPLYERVRDALQPLDCTWEMVYADDGSSDRTWAEIGALHARDSRVKGVRLSRNFGHQYALFAGISHAAGQAVVTLDADLQHPPEVIPELIARWREGSMIVHTVRIDSHDVSFFKRISSRSYYRVYSLLSGVQIDPGMADFRLLDRRVVDGLLQFSEGGLFLRGLVQWVGFPTSKVVFQCGRRGSGSSKYSLGKMLRFGWNGLKSFSTLPLRVATIIGLFTSMGAFLTILYAVGSKLMGTYTLPGWASLLAIEGFLFGVLFVLLGVIGEYVAEVLKEVRRRPRYLLQDELGVDTGAAPRMSPAVGGGRVLAALPLTSPVFPAAPVRETDA
jgi:polyisoprenyl-phosphate glycosyltransferase